MSYESLKQAGFGKRVSLGFSELAVAAEVGAMREIESLLRGRRDQHGFVGDGWGAHIEGACAEMAAAKAIDRYWAAPFNTFRSQGDVGPYEVRRRSKEGYDVLIRTDDDDLKIHIAVFGSAPDYWVAGWLYGHEAKQAQWLKTHGGRPPAWFVPKEQLRDLDCLREGLTGPVE
jgi:hypothetical protein